MYNLFRVIGILFMIVLIGSVSKSLTGLVHGQFSLALIPVGIAAVCFFIAWLDD